MGTYHKLCNWEWCSGAARHVFILILGSIGGVYLGHAERCARL